MEVAIPSHHHLDFDFNSTTRSSPPSTPKGFAQYYFSAPTSPSHLSSVYRHFDEITGGSADTAPFGVKNTGDDFAFDVSEDWETASTSADELFHGGVIKPLKPPPRLQHSTAARIGEINIRKQPNSASQSQTRKRIQGAFSPRRKKETARNDPRSAAEPRRGRERGVDLPKSSSRRAARSLSPIRDTQLYPWVEEEEEEEEEETEQSRNAKNSSSSSSSSVCSILSASAKGNKKWRLKDFFLFRSASEGRASDKDPLRKYTAAFRNSSFRSTDSGSGSGSRRRRPASAHEVHYTVNRAVSEDMKKKTFLPYKQGILGRLAFNPAVHALANGFGFSRK